MAEHQNRRAKPNSTNTFKASSQTTPVVKASPLSQPVNGEGLRLHPVWEEEGGECLLNSDATYHSLDQYSSIWPATDEFSL